MEPPFVMRCENRQKTNNAGPRMRPRRTALLVRARRAVSTRAHFRLKGCLAEDKAAARRHGPLCFRDYGNITEESVPRPQNRGATRMGESSGNYPLVRSRTIFTERPSQKQTINLYFSKLLRMTKVCHGDSTNTVVPPESGRTTPTGWKGSRESWKRRAFPMPRRRRAGRRAKAATLRRRLNLQAILPKVAKAQGFPAKFRPRLNRSRIRQEKCAHARKALPRRRPAEPKVLT